MDYFLFFQTFVQTNGYKALLNVHHDYLLVPFFLKRERSMERKVQYVKNVVCMFSEWTNGDSIRPVIFNKTSVKGIQN